MSDLPHVVGVPPPQVQSEAARQKRPASTSRAAGRTNIEHWTVRPNSHSHEKELRDRIRVRSAYASQGNRTRLVTEHKKTEDENRRFHSPDRVALKPASSWGSLTAPPNSADSNASSSSGAKYHMRAVGRSCGDNSPRNEEARQFSGGPKEISKSGKHSSASSSFSTIDSKINWEAVTNHNNALHSNKREMVVQELQVPPVVVLKFAPGDHDKKRLLPSSMRRNRKQSSHFGNMRRCLSGLGSSQPHARTFSPEFWTLHNRNANCNNEGTLSPVLTPRHQQLINALAPLEGSRDIVSSVKKTLSKSAFIRDWMSRCREEEGPGFNSDGEQSFISAETPKDKNAELCDGSDLKDRSVDLQQHLLDCSFSSTDASVLELEQEKPGFTVVDSSCSEVELARTRDMSSQGCRSCSISVLRMSRSTTGNETSSSRLFSSRNASVSWSDTANLKLNRGFHEDVQNNIRAKLLEYKEYFCGSDTASSSVPTASNSEVSSGQDQSILARAMRKAGIKLSCKNESFRLAMENPLRNSDADSAETNSLSELLDAESDEELASFSVARTSTSSLSIPNDLVVDFNNQFFKTSTPIKSRESLSSSRRQHQCHRPLFCAETAQQSSDRETGSKQNETTTTDVTEGSSLCPSDVSYTDSSSSSSEEEELVDTEFDTTSSDYSDSDDDGNSNTSSVAKSLSLSSVGAASSLQVGDSFRSESDSSLNNLNFTAMIQTRPKQVPLELVPCPQAVRQHHLNTTWHPGMKASPPLGTQLFQRKRRIRRSNARINLQKEFSSAQYSNQGSGGRVLQELRFQTGDDARGRKAQQKTFRVKRYSEDPDSQGFSQLWASKEYIDETAAAVHNLLKTEFSTSGDSE